MVCPRFRWDVSVWNSREYERVLRGQKTGSKGQKTVVIQRRFILQSRKSRVYLYYSCFQFEYIHVSSNNCVQEKVHELETYYTPCRNPSNLSVFAILHYSLLFPSLSLSFFGNEAMLLLSMISVFDIIVLTEQNIMSHVNGEIAKVFQPKKTHLHCSPEICCLCKEICYFLPR